MATPPFNINESLPGDTDVVSQHPANARAFRDTTEDWLTTLSDTYGRVKVQKMNTAARDALTATVDGTLILNSSFTPLLLQRWNGAAWEDIGPAVASETVAGVLEIVTQAELNTGTAPDKIVTPDKLVAWAPPMATVTPDTAAAGDKALIADTSDGGKWKQALLSLLRSKIASYQQRAASGTNGPSYTANSWNAVTITHEVIDTDGIASFSGSDITIAEAGKYRVTWGVSVTRTGANQTVVSRLRNVSDSTTIGMGLAAQGQGGSVGTDNVNAHGEAVFTLTASKAIRVEVFPPGTPPGFNTSAILAASTGEDELYAYVTVEKLP